MRVGIHYDPTADRPRATVLERAYVARRARALGAGNRYYRLRGHGWLIGPAFFYVLSGILIGVAFKTVWP